MGFLFKDIYCADCGKKTKFLTRMTFADKAALCSKCSEKIPSYMTDSVRNNYTYQDYLELKEYVEHSQKELKPQFHETHKYYNVHIDTDHRLLYIDGFSNGEPLYVHLYNVDELNFTFSAEEFKEGVFNDKVTGKVLMSIRVSTPSFYYEKIVDQNAKSKAKKEFFGTRVAYENPKGMDEFMLFFNTAKLADLEAEYDRLCDEEEELGYEYVSLELQQAMSLFMIDELDKMTLSELKAQRNKLIKTFHPDKANEAETKYAQKINAAYEILKSHVPASDNLSSNA